MVVATPYEILKFIRIIKPAFKFMIIVTFQIIFDHYLIPIVSIYIYIVMCKITCITFECIITKF